MEEGGGGGEETYDLEFTPTWIVAAVVSIIIIISLLLERFLHYVGKVMKRRSQKALFEAVLKVKEELMLLGFISLMLTMLQGPISHICIPEVANNHMLPCSKNFYHDLQKQSNEPSSEHEHGEDRGHTRRLLEMLEGKYHCEKKGKVQLLSLEAIHQLHIFIFVLAIAHVILSVLTICLGGLKIRIWKKWEEEITTNRFAIEEVLEPNVVHVQQHAFIKERFSGAGRSSSLVGWLHSFTKQFHASVTESDYATLRLGFIMSHCKANPKFDFHKYMVKVFEADFKKVIGISWYLWIFVIVFLLLNVHGWQTLFWMTFLPLVLLLAVGTKLEHVIAQLAKEVAEKHTAIEGDLVVQPSDDHFWFQKPRILLHLIHFILFQNAFEIAFFFWLWVTYGFHSCIMGKLRFIIPRLVIQVFVQVLCSFSTLPLYAIVTQMGTSFKREIFDEHVQASLAGWVQKVKRKKVAKPTNVEGRNDSMDVEPNGSITEIELKKLQETPLVKIERQNSRSPKVE